MAGVVEEIFRIKSDTAQVLSQIQQLKGVFTELTEEQKKQVTQLAILEQKEKDLIKARNASTNPTTQIRITKELNENIKQLGFLKDAVDKFAKSETVARVEADALSKSVSNAFKQTQVGGAKKQIELLGEQAAGATKSGFNPLNNSLNQLSRELPAFAVSANVGFLAISNNLPMFFEALEKVKKENAALASKGKQTTSVMSQLGGAIFSVSSLLSIGVTLLTVYGAKWLESAINMFKSTDALNLNTEAMQLHNESIEKSVKNQEDLIALREKNYVQTLKDTKKITDVEQKLIENLVDFDKRKIEIENRRKEDNLKNVEAQLRAGDKEVEIIRKVEGDKIRVLNKSTGESIKLNKDGSAIVLNQVRSYGEENISLNEKLSEKFLNQRNKQFERELKDLERFYNSQVDVITKGTGKTNKAKTKPEKTIDLSDRIRQLQIDDIKVEQKRERAQAEFDTERAIRDMKLLKATGEQKTALEIALNNDLVNKLEAIDKKYRDKQDDESRAQAKETGDAMNAVLEDNATTEIYLNEKKIKKLEAQGEKADKDELQRLKDLNNKKKFELLDFEQTVELAGLKQNENGQINEAERDAILTKYANKRKKLQAEIDDSVKKSTTTAREEMLKQIGYYAQLQQAIINALQKVIAMKIAETDSHIAQQEKNVAATKEIADRGNAQILELEQKRLDDLNKKKEKYVRQQQSLAVVELIANTAIAVSKAAAQGGVAAGITIAATLIALVAGLASARSIAGQAAFYEGGYTGDGNPREESGAVGKRPYIYHKGEFVMDHKKTRQFRDIFEDIHGGKVDLNEWKNKVSMYDAVFNGKQPFNLTNPYMNHPQVTNIIQFKQMEAKMDEMNRTLGALKLGLNVDEDGFTTFMQKRVERKNLIKNAAKL